MQCHLRLAAFVFLSAVFSLGQESYHADNPELMARLSYDGSLTPGAGVRKICIAVTQSGAYRLLLISDTPNGPTRLRGKMDQDQLSALKKLLTARDFRSLSGNHGGVIRDHAETFMAEISRIEIEPSFQLQSTVPSGRARSTPGPPRRLQWLNADDQNPFPVPMAKVIDWMKDFKPGDASPLDYAEISDVCPSVGLRLVQPSIATNDH